MIIKEDTVWNSSLRKSFYFTLVHRKNDTKIYRNNFILGKGRAVFTDYIEGKDGKNFEREEKKVLKGSCLSHNFFPFIGQGGKYYGIGGMDSWKNNYKWHSTDTFDSFKEMFSEKYGREYDKNEARYKKAFGRLTTEENILDFSDGLYLTSSKTGINWDKPKKIITTLHKGFNSALQWKATEFDGHLCCMYDGEKYILYTRNNIARGSRYIQYATSKDLLSWSEFRDIKFNIGYDIKTENYYYPCFFKYKDFFVGLLPYFVKDKACLRLVKSYDGFNWIVCKELFVSEPYVMQGKLKNPFHPVNGGIIKIKGKVNFFIHENYQGVSKNSPVTIGRYSISEKNFDKMLNENI